ncbi:MAG: tRNA 2-thiouridine(34) synthase MnmA [Planctomycetota bacterium]
MLVNGFDIKLLEPSFAPWSPQKSADRQIAVLMSGGVDSSVSAALLKQEGWDVLGVTMKIPVCSTGKRSCCGADAAFVCNELKIPHYFVDVTEPFRRLIIEQFRRAYAAGETPNPCADCNALLKFSLVWDFLKATFQINYLATGHYARIIKKADGFMLARAKDKAKDQSYFLYGTPAKNLRNLIFPLGELTKKEVRSIAAQMNLCTAEKPESMELCFAGEGDYRTLLETENADRPGDLTDMQGKKIATHKGIANYTIGQRRGLRFAGGKPLYVGRIDPATNTVALGTREELCRKVVSARDVNVLISEQLSVGVCLFGKIRSYNDPQPCIISQLTDTFEVEFDEAQFAPCPGQKLVLYDKEDNVVAGGTIVQQVNPAERPL